MFSTSQFKVFCLFFSLFLSQLSQADEHWVVKKGAFPTIEVAQEEELITRLSELGFQIEVCDSAEDWKWSPWQWRADIVPPANILVGESLYEGIMAKILLSNDRRLYITPLRKVSRIEDLHEEEIIEMRLLAAKLSRVFQEAFGTRGYVEHIPNGKKAGQIGDQIYAEIIPAGAIEECDLLAKINRFSFFLSNGQYGGCSLPEDQVQAIKGVARPILDASVNVVSSRGRAGSEWTRLSNNYLAAAKQAARILLCALQDEGKAYRRFESGTAKDPANEFLPLREGDEFTGTHALIVKECAFCKPLVIERQRIISGEYIDLLYNYSPFILFKHFMCVSHDHVENRADLTREEILEEHQLIMRVGNYFVRAFKNRDYKVWMQSGMPAGQTVMHHHCHIVSGETQEMLRWLAMVICELRGKKNLTATDAHIAEVKHFFETVVADETPPIELKED